jgi:hypothetical protein
MSVRKVLPLQPRIDNPLLRRRSTARWARALARLRRRDHGTMRTDRAVLPPATGQLSFRQQPGPLPLTRNTAPSSGVPMPQRQTVRRCRCSGARAIGVPGHGAWSRGPSPRCHGPDDLRSRRPPGTAARWAMPPHRAAGVTRSGRRPAASMLHGPRQRTCRAKTSGVPDPPQHAGRCHQGTAQTRGRTDGGGRR